ncbi:hypothetical protein [Streptomyces sp. NBC_01422]|uniref:hypothetical protein n=1 Tax=Streptomyces sp. NBC_01422 TaxID=2903859 RepID=UPI002E28DA5B|nr:hypothetical protein [Streptomyces sp. NBC_01422]
MSDRTATTGQEVLTQGTVVHCPNYVNGENTGLRKAVVLGLHDAKRPQDGYRVYFYASGPADSFRRVSGQARHTEITSVRKVPASPPVTHRFDSTGEANDAVQWDDTIADGDLIVVEPEGVVGFLELGWARAITTRRGKLEPLRVPAREVSGGRYADTYAAAAHEAHALGSAVAPHHALEVKAPVRAAAQAIDPTARFFKPVFANLENPQPIAWVYLVGRGDTARFKWIAADGRVVSAESHRYGSEVARFAWLHSCGAERPQDATCDPSRTWV